MDVCLIGSESLGVRGLSSFINLGKYSVLIDPGTALGFTRYGLHPHPIQAAVSELCKVLITYFWLKSTDIVITHLHGDHIPLYNANPFQYPLSIAASLESSATIWVGSSGLSNIRYGRVRLKWMCEYFGERLRSVTEAVVARDGLIEFSSPYPHGLCSNAKVIAVKVGSGRDCVAHLSDTQLLVEDVISQVRCWDPKVVITDGPPLYRLSGAAKEAVAERAYRNALELANCADYVVIDHHVARSIDGLMWLEKLRRDVGDRVMCAADYMGRPRMPLEAWRRVLYDVMPVPNDWFAQRRYRGYGELLSEYGELIAELTKLLPRECVLEEDEVRRIMKDAIPHYK